MSDKLSASGEDIEGRKRGRGLKGRRRREGGELLESYRDVNWILQHDPRHTLSARGGCEGSRVLEVVLEVRNELVGGLELGRDSPDENFLGDPLEEQDQGRRGTIQILTLKSKFGAKAVGLLLTLGRAVSNNCLTNAGELSP